MILHGIPHHVPGSAAFSADEPTDAEIQAENDEWASKHGLKRKDGQPIEPGSTGDAEEDAVRRENDAWAASRGIRPRRLGQDPKGGAA